MIVIRVDANEAIAMGHMVRCVTIAKECKEMGQEVLFIISEPYAKEYIEMSGFSCICLNNSYKEKQQEVECIIKIIKQQAADLLLLDSYEVDRAYIERLHDIIPVAYMDDMRLETPAIDIRINYAINADKAWYPMVDENVTMLLGSTYAPIRKEFNPALYKQHSTIKNVFITTGGTDTNNMLMEIAQRLLIENKATMLHIVAGKFYPNIEQLRAFEIKNKRIKVYFDIPDIYNVMLKCDIAISAGGTTLAELCTIGVPTIAFAIADNQINGTKAMDELGIIEYAGNVCDNKSIVLNNIVSLVKKMASKKVREQMSGCAKGRYNGRGAFKIAEEICKTIR